MPVLTESVAGYVSGISAIVEACQPMTLSLWGWDCYEGKHGKRFPYRWGYTKNTLKRQNKSNNYLKIGGKVKKGHKKYTTFRQRNPMKRIAPTNRYCVEKPVLQTFV